MRASRCFIERGELPALVIPRLLERARTYRQAVRWCWRLRRPTGLLLSDVGKEYRFVRPHLTDYVKRDDRSHRRDLPAKRIPDFEAACGNAFVSQWIAMQAGLSPLQAERAAA